MKHLDDSIRALFSPEEMEMMEKRYQELMESPDIKRFWYLGERYYSGEATPEEREEYEAETAWMKNLPKGLVPDDHPLSMGGFPSKKRQKKRSGSQENTPGDAGAAAP
jgi:hypothetical protein